MPTGSTKPPKRPLFAALMLLIPILFFVAAEGVLRVVGYGEDYPLFVPVPGYEEYLYPSENVARRYFPAANTIPGIPFDSFPKEKPEHGYRIFVQGGSTAAGFPFYYGGSFADMLEQRLLQTYPGWQIEVVNTSMAAVNSFTIYDFVDEIIAQEPDLVIVYAGHNEYYGALGVGSTINMGPSPGLTRAYLKLRRLRLVQGLRALLASVAGLGKSGIEADQVSGTLMEQVVGNQSIPLGSEAFDRGIAQFRSNIRRVLARYQEAEIPVLIGTVSSNLRDHKPFVPEDESIWRDARSADAAGHHAQALETYVRAKDDDQLRFRAPEQINDVIREEAARAGATVVETYDRLAAAAEDGIIGDDLMTEHLHPNIEGYFQLSSAFYESVLSQIDEVGAMFYVRDAAARSELLITSVDSLTGMLRVKQLMGSWPFQQKGVVVSYEAPGDSADAVEKLAYQLATRATNRRDALDDLRGHHLASGDYHEALKAVLAIIQRYPFAHQPYISAASIMVEQRRLPEALEYVEASLERRPTSLGFELKGSVLLALGRRDEAIPILRQSIELNSNNVNALYNLAGGLALEGNRDEARQLVRRILELAPEHPGALRLGGSIGE